MASPTQPLLLCLHLAILFGLIALSFPANARPCKTLFISSYSVSFSNTRNPPSKPLFVTVFSEIRPLNPIFINKKPTMAAEIFIDRPRTIPSFGDDMIQGNAGIEARPPHLKPSGFGFFDLGLLRDRTRDILSVVVALLFGVGCGALTAATMYLGWSLFSNRNSFYDDYGGDEDEIQRLKKAGYVKIPAVESQPAPAKEAS